MQQSAHCAEEEMHMPQPTEILKQEHNAILRMLDAAEALAGRIGSGELPEPELLAGVTEFFELFLDRCHHGKEENLFFPLLWWILLRQLQLQAFFLTDLRRWLRQSTCLYSGFLQFGLCLLV